jgi:hypothetical protein
MLTREQIDVGVLVVAPIVAGWIFVRVAREEISDELTATDEMRARKLEFYKPHLTTNAAAYDGATALRESNRAGLGLGATPNHTRPMGIRK